MVGDEVVQRVDVVWWQWLHHRGHWTLLMVWIDSKNWRLWSLKLSTHIQLRPSGYQPRCCYIQRNIPLQITYIQSSTKWIHPIEGVGHHILSTASFYHPSSTNVHNTDVTSGTIVISSITSGLLGPTILGNPTCPCLIFNPFLLPTIAILVGILLFLPSPFHYVKRA